MKKLLFCLVLFFTAAIMFANDTYFFTSGGNLIPAEDKDISIEMKAEVISIVLQPKYYEVTVDFEFYNSAGIL